MKPDTSNTALARPKLFVNDYSRTIFKQKPKIRIIHIVEPQIIKTDVENFQELVQRLTGKPVERKGNKSTLKTSPRIMHQKPYFSKTGHKIESTGGSISKDAQKVKKEIEEICDVENQNAAFLSLLEDLDGFLHDMNEFPLVSFRSSQINTIW